MKKQTEENTEEKINVVLNKKIATLLAVIVLALLGGASYLIYRNANPVIKTVVKKEDSKTEIKALLDKINLLIDLPSGESPTIATVSDKTKLDKQSFFSKAENGDKVLIYNVAKKALIYRPSTNKIIEVAPLVFSSPAPSPDASNSPKVSSDVIKIIPITIYNGTKIIGLAATGEKKLTDQYKNIQIVEKANAAKDYAKTTVVDITGNNPLAVKSIATFLSGVVAPMPAQEKAPKGEILVIMGMGK